LTFADLYLFAIIEHLGERKEAAFAHFPHVKKLDENIRSHAQVAEWLNKRPKTEF
jgi:hypothetical protein